MAKNLDVAERFLQAYEWLVEHGKVTDKKSFAKKIGVAFSTVNRWESGRAKPNLKAMKNINTFCLNNNIPYETIEEAWLNYKIEK